MDVTLTGSVVSARTARIIEADGTAAGDGGSSIGDVDRRGAVAWVWRRYHGSQCDLISSTDDSGRTGDACRTLSINASYIGGQNDEEGEKCLSH